jgi:lipid II:glycine glycyltransferase (peptidoglycan interpeptide bridge formation enzyme)
MDIRFATTAEVDQWNSKILANPDGGNVFQGDEFAEQKKLTGWAPRFIIAGDVSITMHEKSVFGLGKLWYAPKGPGVSSPVQLGDMLPALQAFAAQNDVFAIKVEPEITKSDDALQALTSLGLVPVAPIQPNSSTILLDISPDIDTVLASLNQKGRHAILRAARDGVTVEAAEPNEENCKLFYQLLQETAAAQGFSDSIRGYEYYRKFWQRYALAGLGKLFFASYNGQIIAGAFALVFGEKSTYKDGASRRVEGTYGVTHLLQWHIIRWAKEQGATQHDLCGTPPSDQINDESHPHYGVGKFKTNFNKQVTDYVGAFDLPVKPRQYGWWVQFGERLAKRAWWKKHHESWY